MSRTKSQHSTDRQTEALLEERRQEILAQPSAMKEVYAPVDHYVNGHVILRRPDGWHLFYHPMEPHPPGLRRPADVDSAWAGR